MKLYFRPFLTAVIVCSILSRPVLGATAQTTDPAAAPLIVSLPSAAPSGVAVNDQVWFDYYAPPQAASTKSPAVILLHYLGSTGGEKLQELARFLNRRGMAVAQVTLPYHGRRRVAGERPVEHFVGDADKVSQAFAQSASDMTTVVDWLVQQPGVDPARIGAVGISLGAIVVHLAIGRDPRINAGVAALGAGNFANNYHGSLANRVFIKPRVRGYNAQDTAKLNLVDPLYFADRNRPRRVLMIQAARDVVLPPRYAQELWEALGRPPIQWIDVNHPGLALGAKSLRETTAAYLETAWSYDPDDLSRVPRVRVPTLKAGFLVGLDASVTPAVQYQFFSIGTRRHMALLHANAGWSGRGPFLGVATTVTQFVDVGLGRRLGGDKIRPYASIHIVY
jgi:dienelactone hydrolase